MTKRYQVTRRAEQDVLEIWLYIAQNNMSAADKLVDRFTEVYERLAENPALGSVQEQYRLGLRCFPVGNYIIFYSATNEGIEIYRVLHGARQLENLL